MNEGYSENNEYCIYRSPLSARYASKEMQYNFSDMKKFSTWRLLWVYLAKAQKVVKEHSSEEKLRMNHQNIPTSAIMQHNRNQVWHGCSSDIGAVSSYGSKLVTLEQMMDDFIYGQSSIASVPARTKGPVERLETGVPNVNSISADANSALLKDSRYTSGIYSTVDVNGAVGGPQNEAVSRLQSTGPIMSGMRTYGFLKKTNPSIYNLHKEDYLPGKSFGPGEKFLYTGGLVKPQIMNCSDRDYKPQRQACSHGTTRTPTLFSDDVRSNECVGVTQLSLQERTAQSELLYGQTLQQLNRLKVGRAIRGSATGPSTMPTTSSIKTELAFPRSQNFAIQKCLQGSKFDESLVPVSGTRRMNMWTGGNEALSVGKCMPSMKHCHVAGNVVANKCNATSRERKTNNTARSGSLPCSGSGFAVFMNCNRTDGSITSFRGKQEILPGSDVGSILPSTSNRSAVYCRNAPSGIQNDSSNFNRTRDSTVFIGGRFNTVNQGSKVPGAPFSRIYSK